jgi:hypothetical protein
MGRGRLLPHHVRPHCRAADVAVAGSRALTSAPLVLLGGLAFNADGIAVGTDGFTGVCNLDAWAAFILTGVIATITTWRRPHRRPRCRPPINPESSYPPLISPIAPRNGLGHGGPLVGWGSAQVTRAIPSTIRPHRGDVDYASTV